MISADQLIVSVGQVGNTGNNGVSFTIPTVATTNVYGSTASSTASPYTMWNRTGLLPLTGGTFNSLRFSPVAVASPTDLSRHIALWGTQYGFSITSNTLNVVSAAQIRCVYAGGVQPGQQRWLISGRTYYGSANTNYGTWNTSNGDLIGYNNNEALMGWYSDASGSRQVYWRHLQATAYSSGTTPISYCNGRGVVYTNVGGNGFNFRWDGSIWGRVDNAVEYPFARACDEIIKQDEEPSDFDCLSVVNKLRLYKFRWKNHKIPGRPKQVSTETPMIPIGFIAQRLHEDYPDGVQKPRQEKYAGAVSLWNADTNIMLATIAGSLKQIDKKIDDARSKSI